MEAYRSLIPPFNDRILLKGKTSDVMTIGEFTLQCTADNKIIMWNWKTAKSRYVFSGHEGIVSCISPSDKSGQFYSGAWDGRVCRWLIPNKLTKEASREIKPQVRSERISVFIKSIASCKTSSGRELVIAGFNDGTVRILDGETLDFLDTEASSELHTIAVNSIITWYTSLGIIIITGSSDRTVRFSLLKEVEVDKRAKFGEYLLEKLDSFCPVSTGLQNDSTSVWNMSVCNMDLFHTKHTKINSDNNNENIHMNGEERQHLPIYPRVLEGDNGILCVATGDKYVRLYKISITLSKSIDGEKTVVSEATCYKPKIKYYQINQRVFPDWVLTTAPIETSDIKIYEESSEEDWGKGQVTFFCGCRDGRVYPFRTDGSVNDNLEDIKTGTSEITGPDAPFAGNVGHICAIEIAYMKDTSSEDEKEIIPVLITAGTEMFLYRRRLVKDKSGKDKGPTGWGDEEGDDDIKDLLDDPEVLELQQKRLRAMLEADIKSLRK